MHAEQQQESTSPSHSDGEAGSGTGLEYVKGIQLYFEVQVQYTDAQAHAYCWALAPTGLILKRILKANDKKRQLHTSVSN